MICKTTKMLHENHMTLPLLYPSWRSAEVAWSAVVSNFGVTFEYFLEEVSVSDYKSIDMSVEAAKNPQWGKPAEV
jgi:hypothetical protein